MTHFSWYLLCFLHGLLTCLILRRRRAASRPSVSGKHSCFHSGIASEVMFVTINEPFTPARSDGEFLKRNRNDARLYQARATSRLNSYLPSIAQWRCARLVCCLRCFWLIYLPELPQPRGRVRRMHGPR